MVSYYAGCHFTDNKKNEVLMEFGSMVEPQWNVTFTVIWHWLVSVAKFLRNHWGYELKEANILSHTVCRYRATSSTAFTSTLRG
jgi:hypothetical protein